MSVYSKMYDEALNHYEKIGRMELGSDAHVKTVNCANEMMDRLIERDKIITEDRKLDIEEQKIDVEMAKIKNDSKNRKFTAVITAITTATYIGVHVWTVLSDRKFEAEGFMHTSEAGKSSRRSLLNLVDKLMKK